MNNLHKASAYARSPAHEMLLLEIVRTEKTSLQVIIHLMNFGKIIKKIPVIVGNCTGFAVNRMFFPYNLAAHMLANLGVDIYRIDEVITGVVDYEEFNSVDMVIEVSTFSTIQYIIILIPAHEMLLLEIVRTEKTSLQVIIHLMNFGKIIKKIPVIVGNCTGFAVNRMFFPYNLAAHMLANLGVDIYRIDEVITECKTLWDLKSYWMLRNKLCLPFQIEPQVTVNATYH
eukprot:Gb_11932 [translate_table: standard]